MTIAKDTGKESEWLMIDDPECPYVGVRLFCTKPDAYNNYQLQLLPNREGAELEKFTASRWYILDEILQSTWLGTNIQTRQIVHDFIAAQTSKVGEIIKSSAAQALAR